MRFSVKLEQLTIHHVRNIEFAELTFGDMNVFVGSNAQGKTSVLEAIFLLAFTKSLRTNKEKEVIQYQQSQATIQGVVWDQDYKTTYQIELRNDTKTTSINQDIVGKISDYVGNIPVVLFSPDDLELIKGEPGVRRRFFDLDVGQTSKYYLHEVMVYRQLLKRRNDQLRQGHPLDDYMMVLTERLALYGEQIVEKRKEFIDYLLPYVQAIHDVISDNKEQITIEYTPKYQGTLFRDLSDKYQMDLQAQTTTMGPHRDDFEIRLNGKDASKYGSQGQQRSVVLSLKLGLANYIESLKHSPPLLLLDDVFSELDEVRVQALLDALPKDTQTFITATSLDVVKTKQTHASIFIVDAGKVQKQ
jgi:DNA replication and repair protein RecF